MSNTTETTAYDKAFTAAEMLPLEDETTATSVAEVETKRTDRPATAIIRLPGKEPMPVSGALEAIAPVDVQLIDEIARKLRAPLDNLSNLFQLIMDDIDAMPILHSEMLSEIKSQLFQVEQAVEDLNSDQFAKDHGLTSGQVSRADLVAAVLEWIREIRTPVANMQGVLSLVLDDRSNLSSQVAEMLLVAYEQLEKLAKVMDTIGESANLLDGKIEVDSRNAPLEQIVEKAVQLAREEGFETDLVRLNQIPADLLPEISATRGQCLEALLRHALLDTLNFPNDLPVGLFVYASPAADGPSMAMIEIHDHCTRPSPSQVQQNTLDQQIVLEMTHALQGHATNSVDGDGKHVLAVTIPFDTIRTEPLPDLPVVAAPANAHTCHCLALLTPARRLTRTMEHAIASHVVIRRIGCFAQLLDSLANAHLPTVLVDADLFQDLSAEELEQLDTVLETVNGLFVLQHGEADMDPVTARFPILWDDDTLAITGMLEQPLHAAMPQENLILITGDNATEVRPWRKLLSSTGNGSMWWPAARPIPAGRFPQRIGGVVVVAESTMALPMENWNALSQLSVRDRKIIVLTGPGSCQLPRARCWDIYRPNLNVCDDTLRRYILFNAPTQQTPRVAIIEDDILMRKLLVSAIQEQAQVVEMGSVHDALTNLRTLSFDVILTDLFLPDGSGIEILKAIHSDPCLAKARSTPIIALTGSDDLELNQQVLDAGATEVLVKPVPMQVLRQKIALMTRQNRCNRISGPIQVPSPAAAVPAAALTPAPKRLPGASKIINLRKIAASMPEFPASQNTAVGD